MKATLKFYSFLLPSFLTCLLTYLLTNLLTSFLTYVLTPWRRVLHEEPTGSQLVRKYPEFYGTQSSLQRPHVPATCTYPEPPRSSPCSNSRFLKIHLNIILQSMSGPPKWSLSLRCPHQNRVYVPPLPHTCYMPRPCHFSRFYHPNNIWWAVQIIQQYRSFSSTDHSAVQIIQQYRSSSSSLFSFLHSPVTLSLLKLRGLSPRANYTDRAAAAGRRS